MYGLIYFDTEDFVSPPDSPVHRLPGQLADVMHRHGLVGCFHIHGEKARFMERHGQSGVVEAIRRHDVSLHFDRGSLHPTTAEEVSQLGWFDGVDRVLFRELPGFQALERIFGKCSGLTQHGGTFAAQIVYAAGKLGKPFFYSPFRLPGRNVVWYCNSLLIGGYQGGFYFDPYYRDTPKFEQSLAKVDAYLDQRAASHDFTAMFGCHPVITMMEKFPDAVNFVGGASPPPGQWVAPTPVEGVSIPLILENFERLVARLVAHPRVEWTTVAGIAERYGRRPVRVADRVVVEGAKMAVAGARTPRSDFLSDAELLVLLARRVLAPAESYPVPQVMGPLEDAGDATLGRRSISTPHIARQVLDAVMASGYLPATVSAEEGPLSLEVALHVLATPAAGWAEPPGEWRERAEARPSCIHEAEANVRRYKDWRVHGDQYHQDAILKHFRLQCWTLKPAFTAGEYPDDVELGRHLNPMAATEDWT